MVLLKTWRCTQRSVAWHTHVLCETPLLSLPRAGEADLAVPPGPAALQRGGPLWMDMTGLCHNPPAALIRFVLDSREVVTCPVDSKLHLWGVRNNVE